MCRRGGADARILTLDTRQYARCFAGAILLVISTVGEPFLGILRLMEGAVEIQYPLAFSLSFLWFSTFHYLMYFHLIIGAQRSFLF